MLLLSASFQTHAAQNLDLNILKGLDVLTGKAVQTETKDKKGIVTVFLSAKCPCSNSHIQELTELAKVYPEFQFIGVHSNVDEDEKLTKAYFETTSLPFPVLQDENTKIADKLGAVKTPHAFVMDPEGKLLYKGGVSNSHDAIRADRKYLREALQNLKENKPVKTPEGRTLGCAISRGEKNVW